MLRAVEDEGCLWSLRNRGESPLFREYLSIVGGSRDQNLEMHTSRFFDCCARGWIAVFASFALSLAVCCDESSPIPSLRLHQQCTIVVSKPTRAFGLERPIGGM